MQKRESLEIPNRFSVLTIIGLALTIAGVLIGFFVLNYIGVIVSISGLMLILSNIYKRHVLLHDGSVMMFPPKALLVFYAIAIIVVYFIYMSPNSVVLFAFTLAITLRVLNLVLHKLEQENMVPTDKLNVILLLVAVGIVIFAVNFLPLFHIETIIGLAENNFILYIMMFSAMLFPVLTGVDVALNEGDNSKFRRKMVTSAIKIFVVLIIVILVGLSIVWFPLQVYSGYMEYGLYVLFVPGAILLILGLIRKD
ncbi:MAG: hypothetical protein ACTSR8_19305 [Promethearchaeota archaeon]